MTDMIPKWQRVTGWVLSGILSLVFLPSAFFKITQPKGFIEEWSKTYPAGSALPLGIIELTLFVLYLVPKTRYLGGLLMLAYLGGPWRPTSTPTTGCSSCRSSSASSPGSVCICGTASSAPSCRSRLTEQLGVWVDHLAATSKCRAASRPSRHDPRQLETRNEKDHD